MRECVVAMFLGRPRMRDGRYQEVSYCFSRGDQTWESAPSVFFGDALIRWLRRTGVQPSQLVILGTTGSIWDKLLSDLPDAFDAVLAGGHEDVFERVEARVQSSTVEAEDVQAVSAILSKTLGLEVNAQLIPHGQSIEEELSILRALYPFVSEGVELHLDITHGFRHQGMIAVEGAMMLRQLRNVHVAGVYYAMFRGSGEPALGLRLESLDALAAWSEAVSTYRSTGLLTSLPKLFEEHHDIVSVQSLRTLHFALMTTRYERAFREARTFSSGLTRLTRERPESIAAIFAEELIEELRPLAQADMHCLPELQLRLARQAMSAGDFTRACIYCFEALVSASIVNPEKRLDHSHRRQINFTTEIDPRLLGMGIKFSTLSYVRNALAHGSEAGRDSVSRVLCSDQTLRDFLEQAIRTVEEVIPVLASAS